MQFDSPDSFDPFDDDSPDRDDQIKRRWTDDDDDERECNRIALSCELWNFQSVSPLILRALADSLLCFGHLDIHGAAWAIVDLEGAAISDHSLLFHLQTLEELKLCVRLLRRDVRGAVRPVWQSTLRGDARRDARGGAA